VVWSSQLKASHWVCKPAYLVPVPRQDKLGVAAGRASGVNIGMMADGLLISQDGVAPSQLSLSLSAFVIFPCANKI